MAFVQLLAEVDPQARTQVGGKAANLARLQDAGFPVPSAFVIPVDVAMEAGDFVASWPADLLESVGEHLLKISPAGEPVAVRSSAVEEDGAQASFAGQYETVLDVRGAEAVFAAIQCCLDSFRAPSAVAYRTRAGRATGADGMAIIVQRMVPAEFAGVAFGVDPLTGDRSRILVESVAGLGNRLVSGEAEADRYVFARDSLVQLERHAAAGSLSAAQARDVAKLVLAVEEEFSEPQDIEFAFAAGKLWLLQSRPITGAGLGTLPGGGWKSEFDTPSGPGDLWTSANVQEVLPGVLTPLTITAYTEGGDKAYVEGYRRLHLVGRDEWPRFAGYFYNRAFLNVSAIRQIAERSLGSNGDTLDHRLLGAPYNPNARGKRSLDLYRWRMRSFFPLLRLVLTASRQTRQVEKAIRKMESSIRTDAPAAMSSGEIQRRRNELAAFSAEMLLVHLNVSGLAAVGFDVISGMLKPIWKDDAEGQMPALFSGMLGVDSAQIGLDLWKLSRIALSERIADSVRDPSFDPRAETLPPSWRVAFAAFIARHGHRGLAEMELSAITWRYDPAPVLAIVRAYLDLPESRSPEATLKRQEKERLELTADLGRRMSAPRRLLFRGMLTFAQKAVVRRERTKSLAVRAIRLGDYYRETIQQRLVAGGFISKPDDMFFLADSELSLILDGGATGGYQERVTLRRREYERNRYISLPDRFTGHPVPLDDLPTSSATEVMTGTPVSPGSVTGRARVIRDPNVDSPLQPGEILVAPVTDAGWTPLFAIAAGLVVDMGSALSHGSTVAREYGLPAVVNVRGATRTIHSGDLIAVNGSRGTVTILEPAGDST